MKIVVDTNIVISAIINDKGKIGELLLYKPADIQFFSSFFLIDELNKHTEKILKITGYGKPDFQQVKSLLLKEIDFVGPEKISRDNWKISHQMLLEIDENDTAFLALNFEIDGLLWTGDKKLIKVLETKGYHNIITTDNLYSKYF